jgi:hypothetical protein
VDTDGPREGWSGLSALPEEAAAAAERAATARPLEVDGEVFSVSVDRGGTHYEWMSGPNPGYGFTVGPTRARPMSLDEHRALARDFLAQVDPATGYIEDD